MNVPALCEKRPIYQGRLVPSSVKWFDGVPDFKVTDPEAVERCINERFYGVCGNVIGARVTFVGGLASIANRLFTNLGSAKFTFCHGFSHGSQLRSLAFLKASVSDCLYASSSRRIM